MLHVLSLRFRNRDASYAAMRNRSRSINPENLTERYVTAGTVYVVKRLRWLVSLSLVLNVANEALEYRDRVLSRTLRNASASIWRMRSHVNENCRESSLRVPTLCPIPKRIRRIISSRGASVERTFSVCTPRLAGALFGFLSSAGRPRIYV